ncbi:MAG TPA: response regulator, partial [Gammaproteobacteria bacterium]|nr:response regulator [Gammaproteobacteria bacterium]
MSEPKHALVVDDSRSARLVLRRMLEKYGLKVDTVNSGSKALEFLKNNRPDVIFMDHMMPGMDGFEAVKAIKSNPETATIPVLMYTSKGGDLYLGQARALGAVGVLPKTVAPAELFSALKKIGLAIERRKKKRKPDDEGASERAEDIQAVSVPMRAAPRFTEPGMRQQAGPMDESQLDAHFRRLLEEQSVEFRKDVLLSMETVARQTSNRLEKELDEKLESLQQTKVPTQTGPPLLTVLLTVLLFISLILSFYMLSNRETTPGTVAAVDGAMASETQRAAQAINELNALYAERTNQLGESWLMTGWALNQEFVYPYNELALDKQRVDAVEQLLEKLSATGYSGKIILETHVGQFCLVGNQEKGFHLPPPDMTVDKCEFTGNPVQPTDSVAAHQSLRFANFISSSLLLREDVISIEVVSASREDPLFVYPEKS